MREPVSFFDALQSCQSMNSSLSSVHSIADNNYLSDLASQKTLWLGLIWNTTQAQNWTVSQTITEKGTWIWTDGSPVDIKLWSRGGWYLEEPEQADCLSSCCATFTNTDGMWNHAECNDPVARHGFVCQFEAFPNATSSNDMRDMLVQLIKMSENMKHDQETAQLLFDSLESASNRNTDLLEQLEGISSSCRKLVIVTLVILLVTSSVVLLFGLFTGCSCASVRFPTTRLQKLQFSFANTHDDEDPICRE